MAPEASVDRRAGAPGLLLYVLELFGVAVFAASGALAGMARSPAAS